MAVFTWTGGAGTRNFGTAANWDDVTTGQNPSPVAPGGGDTAEISATGTITGSGSVADFYMMSQGGPLTMGAIVNAGTFVTATGTVAIAAGATITAGQNFAVNGSASVVTVGVSAALSVTGVAGLNYSGLNVAYGTTDVGTFNVAGGQVSSGSNAIIGGYGHGTAVVSAGGTLALGTWQAGSTSALVGFYAGSQGTLAVTGAGSRLTATGHVDIGVYGAGTLTVQNGASAVVNEGSFALGVAENAGSTGAVTVSNAQLSLDGFVQIGTRGAGSLTVQSGGTLAVTGSALASSSKYIGDLGDQAGATGTLTVTGTHSLAALAGRFGVGEYGSGTLDVLAGGQFDITNAPVSGSSQLFFGDQAGSSGTGLVSGKGSTINTGGGPLNIGNYGTATLTVAAGGTIDVGTGYTTMSAVSIGSQYGAVGALVVTDNGSVFDAVGQVLVGNNGTGSALVENGATMLTGGYDGYQGIDIAANSISPTQASNGTLTVTGSGSSLVNSGRFQVGGTGAGTLTIAAGAHVATTLPAGVNTYGALIGGNTRSTGVATVTGAGSSWSIGSNLAIGTSGTGTLDVTSGGSVGIGTNLAMAGDELGTGILLVDGSNSRLTVGGRFLLGGAGQASATVSNAGSVAVTGSIDINGSLVLSGGAVSTRSALYLDHAGTISGNGSVIASGGAYIDQGTVSAGTGTLSFLGGMINDGALVDMAGGALTLGRVTGAGSITLGGGSTLTLGATGSGQAIAFASNGVLDLTTPASMAGVLQGFAAGDTIDLGSTAATSLAFAGSILTVKNGAAAVARLHFAGTYATANFTLGTSGADTVITYHT